MAATRHEIYKAKTLRELEALERKYAYAYGWAYKVYTARKNKQGSK